MNKQSYLKELEHQLAKLPRAEIEEILADYKEHFEMAQRSGKSEEATVEALGSPRIVAQGHLANNLVAAATQSDSVVGRVLIFLRVLFLILVLAPFNFLMLIGPFIVLFVLTVVGWTIPLALGSGCLVLIGFLLFTASGFLLGSLPGLSFLFLCLFTTGVSLLLLMAMFLVTKTFTQIVLSYLRWNVHFIKARRA